MEALAQPGRLWYTKLVPTLHGGGSFCSPYERSDPIDMCISPRSPLGHSKPPHFFSGNTCVVSASLSRQGPATGETPSLSILIRMAVSAFSANPWALHLPPGPTWHSSYHQAKLCCACQIHIGIYEKKNWRGRMLLTTCHIGCISPRRQARKRRTLQTSKTYFVIVV